MWILWSFVPFAHWVAWFHLAKRTGLSKYSLYALAHLASVFLFAVSVMGLILTLPWIAAGGFLALFTSWLVTIAALAVFHSQHQSLVVANVRSHWNREEAQLRRRNILLNDEIRSGSRATVRRIEGEYELTCWLDEEVVSWLRVADHTLGRMSNLRTAQLGSGAVICQATLSPDHLLAFADAGGALFLQPDAKQVYLHQKEVAARDEAHRQERERQERERQERDRQERERQERERQERERQERERQERDRQERERQERDCQERERQERERQERERQERERQERERQERERQERERQERERQERERSRQEGDRQKRDSRAHADTSSSGRAESLWSSSARLTLSDAYVIIGCSRNDSEEVILKRVKELRRANHPDRVASLDEEIRELANRRSKRINEAYELIRRARHR
jgi:flagellar biosynthesis GTPase FlhF